MRTRVSWWAMVVMGFAVTLTVFLSAQVAISYEKVTFAGTAVGFSTTTLNTGNATAQECRGRLETAEIRILTTGADPTATVGIPVEVGDWLVIQGMSELQRFKGIRTGSTSGVIHFQCYDSIRR